MRRCWQDETGGMSETAQQSLTGPQGLVRACWNADTKHLTGDKTGILQAAGDNSMTTTHDDFRVDAISLALRPAAGSGAAVPGGGALYVLVCTGWST